MNTFILPSKRNSFFVSIMGKSYQVDTSQFASERMKRLQKSLLHDLETCTDEVEASKVDHAGNVEGLKILLGNDAYEDIFTEQPDAEDVKQLFAYVVMELYNHSKKTV